VSKLSRWIEITASISVVIGIVFLIIELQQNTVATENEAAFALQSAMSEQILVAATNEDLFRIFAKVFDNEDLDKDEHFRASLYFSSTMALYEYAFSQYEAGVISETLFKSYEDDIWLFSHGTKFSKSYWKNNHIDFTSGFREYVDSLSSWR
jgi:hypothetical protein